MTSSSDDDGYKVGKGRPPKEHQFKPGKSPNPRGRPPRRTPVLNPGELRRTALMILDEKHEMPTPSGVRKITLFEALLRRLLTGAAKGNPTQLRHALKLIPELLQERVDRHRTVWLVDMLQNIEENSTKPDPLLRETIAAHLKHIKKLY